MTSLSDHLIKTEMKMLDKIQCQRILKSNDTFSIPDGQLCVNGIKIGKKFTDACQGDT